jgi:lysophospholipase L1-like esterase
MPSNREVKFWTVYFVTVILAAIFFVVFLFSTNSFSDEYKKKIRIAFVGDSITGGQFPDDLKNLLGKKFRMSVYVSHKNGARSDVVRRLLQVSLVDSVIKGFHFDYVVVYAGLNDCISPGGVKGASSAFSSLLEMMQLIKANGATPIIIKHHPWRVGVNDGDRNRICSAAYNSMVDELIIQKSMENTVFAVDTSSLSCAVTDSCIPGYLSSHYDAGDGVHLNRLANKILAIEIYKAVDWDARR